MSNDYDNPKNRISRRDFLKTTGLVGAGLAAGGLLAACSTVEPEASGDATVNLTEFIWVGAGQGIVPREVKAEYERDHPNVTIELYEGTNSVTYPKMVAQKEVNPNDPLINFGYFNIWASFLGDKDDMWVSLDPELVPHMDDIFESYHRPDNKGIGWAMSSVILNYNTDYVEEAPTSWMDIFDPKYKGKVMLYDYNVTYNGLMAVAHVLGDDVDAAFKMYSEAAEDGQFHSVFTGPQIIKDAMVRGEVWLAPHFMNFPITWGPRGEGGPFAYAIPEEGMVAFPYFFQIIKGSSDRQIEVASEIIDTYLSPDWISRACDLTSNIPTSKYAKLDRELALEPGFDKAEVERAIQLDFRWLADNDADLKDRWDREVKAFL